MYVEDNLVFWPRCDLLARIISDFNSFRRTGYALNDVERIQSILRLENVEQQSEKELFRRSLEAEPRDSATTLVWN